jgi:hypothetical protein
MCYMYFLFHYGKPLIIFLPPLDVVLVRELIWFWLTLNRVCL